jgi:hypothetical protein
MLDFVYVNVGRVKFQVDRNGQVSRDARGKLTVVRSGPTVDQARRLARNLFALRDSAAKRNKVETSA